MIYLLANLSRKGLESETVLIGPFETVKQQTVFTINLPDILYSLLPKMGLELEPISWITVNSSWPIMSQIEVSPYSFIKTTGLIAGLNGWIAQNNTEQEDNYNQALKIAGCINKIFKEFGIPYNINKVWS